MESDLLAPQHIRLELSLVLLIFAILTGITESQQKF